MWNVVIFSLLLVFALLYAAMRGGAPERSIAMIFLLGSIATNIVIAIASDLMVKPEIELLVIDVSMLIAVGWIACNAERYWPILLTSFLILGVQLQLGIWVGPIFHQQMYKLAHAYSAYPSVILLLAGTWRHQARLREFGEDRGWTVFEGGTYECPRTGSK